MKLNPPPTIPVFKWSGELGINGDQDDPEKLTVSLSRNPAESVLSAIRAAGYDTNVEDPYEGEGGWHFTVKIGADTFSLFTHWTGIGSNTDDYFAIQPSLEQGIFRTLFGKRIPEDRLQPIATVLRKVLPHVPGIADLYWLNDQQFAAAYCDGEPLPNQSA